MFLKTRMMPSSGGPRAARSSETPVVQSSWSASVGCVWRKAVAKSSPWICHWWWVAKRYNMFRPTMLWTGAAVLKVRSRSEGCWKPSKTILALAFLEPSFVRTVLGSSLASFRASSISSGGVDFHVKIHLALMIRWDSDSTALRTSWSPTQRLTAWFFRKLSTSRDLAFSKRARCSGVNFTNWTSALPTFLAMKSEGFLTSCFLWRWESMERSKEIMKASSTQGSWRAVWTSIVWASKATSCWSCSTHFMSYSRFLGRLLSGASECGSPGECSSGRSLMGVPGS